MKKNVKRLLIALLSVMVALGMGTSVFAYTALDDDGVRATAQEGTLHVVATNSGMLRTSDEGTSAVVNADGTVSVTVKSTESKSWGKVTKIALIEKEGTTDAEKDAAAADVTLDNPEFSDVAVQKTFHFTIPVNEIGKKIPVCVYVPEEGWKTYNTQSYYIIVNTLDIYNQLVAAEAAATDDTLKAEFAAAKAAAETALDFKTLELEKLNKVMMTINKATLYKEDGNYKLELEINGTSYTKVYPGYASEANADDTAAIDIVNDKDAKVSYVTIPVSELNQPLVYAFKGSKYFNRTFTVTESKLTYDNTNLSLDQFDAMTTEEAVARAAADTSVETVNQLIAAIQVQKRDENTDKYCTIAKAYYDALSDSDKNKLEDPGYFGDDTGDASKDDPLNTAPDKEKELLVVSFGTSFNDSRAEDIGGIEKALAEAFPDWAVRRAFTAQIIINHVQARDGVAIDNMDQALEKAVAAGVKELVVQPTHLMHGAEYDELVAAVDTVKDKFDKVTIAEPLLGPVGADETVINADKEEAAQAAVMEAVIKAGADSAAALADAKTAIVFMGHGTAHDANITYSQMQTQMDKLGYDNVFIGTVEGIPASTALPEVKKAVEAKGYTKVILRPLMVVAGDHANNDMAADEEGSWYYGFVNGGDFEVEGAEAPVNIGEGFTAENVTCQIEGLGRIPAIQQMYVAHSDQAINPPVAQVLKVTSKNKNIKVKTLKKKAVTYKAITVKGNKGKLTYTAKPVGKKAKKALKFKNGKITVKKGTKKGTYQMQITVKAAATDGYLASKKVTKKVKITVK